MPNYPVDQPDASRWAKAWAKDRDENKIDANGDTANWMTGWFAAAMADGEALARPATDLSQPDETPTEEK